MERSRRMVTRVRNRWSSQWLELGSTVKQRW
jgi:hypothetical protein